MNRISPVHRDAPRPTITIGEAPLTIEQLLALAHGHAQPALAESARARMAESEAFLRQRLENAETIYGVTTGVGASVDTAVQPDHSANFSTHIMRMHGCGTGRILNEVESAAVVAVRICSLARGCSGVRPLIAENLARLLQGRVLPCIPSQGSVGASGDLTPLSYVAATLVGEREVLLNGATVAAEDGLASLELEPLNLAPKEALSLMNGTSVATALGLLAWRSAQRLARLAGTITAMVSRAVGGNPEHFDAFIHDLKPHPGQGLAATWIRLDLGLSAQPVEPPKRLQDRYSIRCAPHVIGVLVDALSGARTVLEAEVQGVSDNPVIDVERGLILHGGNFYGGHVGFTLDALKAAVASLADLLDRQLMLLCSPAENGGLPPNLAGATDADASTHHGFKAMSITASALTAEALKLTMPASAFSRSTENHNQDKVPMATTAARDTLRIAELTEEVTAIALLGACQALDLRGMPPAASAIHTLHAAVREAVPTLKRDRRMDGDIQQVLAMLREDRLPSGEGDLP